MSVLLLSNDSSRHLLHICTVPVNTLKALLKISHFLIPVGRVADTTSSLSQLSRQTRGSWVISLSHILVKWIHIQICQTPKPTL